MTRMRSPEAASAVARLTAVVVLPTPPFWLATAMTRARRDAATGRSSPVAVASLKSWLASWLTGPHPAQAQNDILNQAQKFLGGGGNDQNAYERGRQDEMRRQQIDREHRREARDRERYYDDRRPANGYRDDGYRGR